MFFPIGDDQVKLGHKPVFSYLLILINVLVFFYQLTLNDTQISQLFREYGAIPSSVLKGENLHSLVTSMFLHGGWMHLIGNMLFLWVFADNIEATIGSKRFLIFYFLGGIIAALVHCYVNKWSGIPCIGASGAVSAALGAYLVMFPSSRIRVLFLIWTFRIWAFFFLGFWIFQQVVAGYEALGPIMIETGVGYWAHIGGFAFGFLSGFTFRDRIKQTVIKI